MKEPLYCDHQGKSCTDVATSVITDSKGNPVRLCTNCKKELAKP